MSKQSTLFSNSKHIPLRDDINYHSIAEWLFQNKRLIIGVFLSLLFLMIVSYQILSTSTLKAEKDFFQAQVNFSRFEEKSHQPTEISQRLENLNQLELILNRHPELSPKYEGLIAQSLILEHENSKAVSFSQSIFERMKNKSSSFYLDFALASLLISQSDYHKALIQTEQLQEKMDGQVFDSVGPLLYFFNLLRLSMLYQQVNQPQKELAAWNQLLKFKDRSEVTSLLNQFFKEKINSLQSYIEERKINLNSILKMNKE
jgi:hypothetical protein